MVDDLRFHPSVAAGRLRLPCATTPAEDDAGRPAPKRARQKLSEATKARWRPIPGALEEAMMTDKAGKLHVVPAPVRERLHHIPAGYTDTPHLDDRARHRVLAKGWHWGVAQRLLTILLAASTVQPPYNGSSNSSASAACPWSPRLGRRPTCTSPTTTHIVTGSWRQSCSTARWPRGPGWSQRSNGWFHLWTHWRHDVHCIRQEVLAEIAALVEEMADDTAVWLARRSAPVRATYHTPARSGTPRSRSSWSSSGRWDTPTCPASPTT